MTNERADFDDISKLLGDACRTLDDTVSVVHYVPRSKPVGPLAIIKPGFPTTQYFVDSPGESAVWNMVVMYLLGRVNEKVALARTGALLAPDSKLYRALNSAEIRPGYGMATVRQGILDEVQIGSAMYSYARFDVTVHA